MIEPLHGNDWFVDGEVRNKDDLLEWQPEDESSEEGRLGDDIPCAIAKNKLLQKDEELLDAIISDIHPRRPSTMALGRTAVGNIPNADSEMERVSLQPPIGHVAEEIIAQYREEKARLERYKHQPDLARLRRNVWIAIIRNYPDLSESEQQYIEQETGLMHDANQAPERERDFRERQFKDD